MWDRHEHHEERQRHASAAHPIFADWVIFTLLAASVTFIAYFAWFH